MFSKLKKLFDKTADSAVPPPAVSTPEAAPAPPFLRREAVFGRDNRIAGYLFSVQQSSILADATPQTQSDLDRILLDTLNASPEAWNRSPAVLPLSSASLDSPAVDRLQGNNVTLLLHLAADAEAGLICDAIDQLRPRGLRFGLFRQPSHPAYAKVIQKVDFAAIDVANNEADAIRNFSAAVRAGVSANPIQLFACNVDTVDDHQFCLQWHFDLCHGKFGAQAGVAANAPCGDPHKTQLLTLLHLVQGDAETAEIAAAMKLDPVLSFRILRYLNSPALALTHRIESLDQALIILGRQRLTRWLAVLLFSVREPQLNDWLLVENALTRGRLMEVLGAQLLPGQPHDPLFLTGIFSCLDRLLRRPLAEVLGTMPIADEIRLALLERQGPYAPLLAVAEASEAVDQAVMAKLAQAAGVDPDRVNRALLAATAWASEVTEYWE